MRENGQKIGVSCLKLLRCVGYSNSLSQALEILMFLHEVYGWRRLEGHHNDINIDYSK